MQRCLLPVLTLFHSLPFGRNQEQWIFSIKFSVIIKCVWYNFNPTFSFNNKNVCLIKYCRGSNTTYLFALYIIPTLYHYAYFEQFDWLENKFYTSIKSMSRNLGIIFLPPAPKMCNNVDKNTILMTKLEV